MTHTELCKVAARWVKKKHRCSVVLVDVKTINTREQPDVLGWTNGGWSVLVEVKVDVHDFIRDKHKPFRKHPERGMGRERWYAIPKGLWEKVPVGEKKYITDAVMGGRWGLIEFDARGKSKILLKAEHFAAGAHAAAEEKRLLITCVRRVTEGWGRGIIADTPGELMANGDRHPINRIRELERELHQTRKQRDAFQVTLDKLQAQAAARPIAGLPGDF